MSRHRQRHKPTEKKLCLHTNPGSTTTQNEGSFLAGHAGDPTSNRAWLFAPRRAAVFGADRSAPRAPVLRSPPVVAWTRTKSTRCGRGWLQPRKRSESLRSHQSVDVICCDLRNGCEPLPARAWTRLAAVLEEVPSRFPPELRRSCWGEGSALLVSPKLCAATLFGSRLSHRGRQAFWLQLAGRDNVFLGRYCRRVSFRLYDST